MHQQIKLREGKENADAVLEEFDQIVKLSKVHAGAYAFVKTWFLARYKAEIAAEAKFGNDEDDGKLIALPQ